MEESILVTIKKMLNIDAEITDFDSELIVLINASLSTLYQLGIGESQFSIEGDKETWSQFLDQEYYLESVKESVYIDVKLIFDPPASSIIVEALKERRKEDQWRIASQVDISEQPES